MASVRVTSGVTTADPGDLVTSTHPWPFTDSYSMDLLGGAGAAAEPYVLALLPGRYQGEYASSTSSGRQTEDQLAATCNVWRWRRAIPVVASATMSTTEGGLPQLGMSEPERRKLWVKAGGRCTLCKKYLLEGGLTYKNIFVGEDAHIVGQQQTKGSPRGQGDLPIEERDKADNILLACSSCHTEIDKSLAAEIMTIEVLRRRKLEHENEIYHQTGLTTDRRTTVLRVQGWVRGAAMELTRHSAALAVIWSSNRFPFFLPAYDQQGIEVDLRHIAGEEEGSKEYYNAAVEKIDSAIRSRLQDGIRANDVQHLSIFAIARLPLLIYLGWAVEDGVATDVYQRHRSTGDWRWPHDSTTTEFPVDLIAAGNNSSTDGVLITNTSGTTSQDRLPTKLESSPTWMLSAVGDSAHEDIIDSAACLASFERAIRRFFSSLEATHKHLKRLHIFGGLPVSAAVTLGRSLKAADLRPTVVLYDLTQSGYSQVLEF